MQVPAMHVRVRVQILGDADMDKIMRLQFAIMPPHSQIKKHMDTGGYATLGHRIHAVLKSNPGGGWGAELPSAGVQPVG